MGSQFPPKTYQKPSVLVVEDDALLGSLLSALVEVSGRKVLGPVPSASEATALAGVYKPDMAVVDVHLADNHSGIELAAHLAERCKIPALLMSGSSGDEHGARDIGIGFLEKPFDAETLVASLDAIQRMLNGEMCRRPAGLRLCRSGPWLTMVKAFSVDQSALQ
jgi:DNA-binding response OmpR family regulator